MLLLSAMMLLPGTMEKSIFDFFDRPAVSRQDDHLCRELLEDFWHGLDQTSDLLKLPDRTEVRKKYPRLEWKARYAAVVAFVPLDACKSYVSIVGLDGWKAGVHTSRTVGRQRTAVPNLTEPAVFGLGWVATANVDRLMRLLDEELEESERKFKGSQRGQRKGQDHRGNQKTPSFLRSVLQDVLQDMGMESLIQGGTTDVGRHTGCILRSTSFPLVASVMWWLLDLHGEEDDQTFLKYLIGYFVHYLQNVGDTVIEFDTRLFDRVIVIIRSIEQYLDRVRDEKFKVTVLDVVHKYHTILMDLRPKSKSDPLKVESYAEIYKTLRAPNMPPIPMWELTSTDRRSKMDRARATALINGNMDVVSMTSNEYNGRIENTYLQIATLNEFFWQAADKLFDDQATRETYDITDLRSRLDLLSQHVQLAVTESSTTPHIMTVRFRSEEVVAIWVSFCWAYRTAEDACPILKSYGSALDPVDLQHLVLADIRARNAVDSIRKFLSTRTNKAYRLFRTQHETLKFALQFGLGFDEFGDIYKKELNAATHLIDERWEAIQKTQQELHSLDSELSRAEAQLNYIRSIKHEHTAYSDKLKARNDLQGRIEYLEAKPPDLLLGLPRNLDGALQWLFFLFMPDEFRNLAALAQLGQSKLWQSPPSAHIPKHYLLSWYMLNRKTGGGKATDAELILGSNSPGPFRPKLDIRQYARETGVLFPDSFSVDPAWSGVDPFSSGIPFKDTAMFFTEKLPNATHHKEQMESFMVMLPTTSRENKAIASREIRPDWLNPVQFAYFTNLRAHPHTQIRCLIEVLHDDLLPFHDFRVHILIKQLLYHIGDVDWMHDLSDGWLGYDRLANELRRQLEKIRDSPKDCDGLVSSYLGQYDPTCLDLSFQFYEIARRWADNEPGDDASPEQLLKKAKLYAYALICLAFGDLDDSKHVALFESLVLYRKNAQLASAGYAGGPFNQAVNEMMAKRIRHLSLFIAKNTQTLTRCLSLLFDFIPKTLAWSPVASSSGEQTVCLEAEDEDYLFTVNVFDGSVLVNGVPPSVLPVSVLSNKLYQRTFGDRNFLVVSGLQHFRAAKLVDEHYLYEFQCNSGNSLVIRETDTRTGAQRLLLDRSIIELPEMLRERHSHWYCTANGCVLVRGVLYTDREIRFIMNKIGTFAVPPERREVEPSTLISKLQTFDMLMLGNTSATDVLNEFESLDFVHIFVNPELKRLLLSLPRFKLSFEIIDSKICCIDFSGFTVIDAASLLDTLPHLNSAIAIQHKDGRKQVIIREGAVTKNAEISISAYWDEEIRSFVYDVHKRFGIFQAQTTHGRLHLASIYASCPCSLPERRYGKPTHAIATELVNQCWKNEPFTPDESVKLAEVSSHAALTCSSLSLVCCLIRCCAGSVTFLHGGGEAMPTNSLETDTLAVDDYFENQHAPRLPGSYEAFFGKNPKELRSPISLFGDHESPVQDFVRRCEEDITADMVQDRGDVKPKSEVFPLARKQYCTRLDTKIFDDIEQSHMLYCRMKELCPFPSYREKAHALLELVAAERTKTEYSILTKFKHQDLSFKAKLDFCSGRIEVVTILDMLRLIADDGFVFERLRPDMVLPLRADIVTNCLDWATLCVLEDRIQRICDIDPEKDPQALLSELTCVRKWSPSEHPKWIAFEVEQCLQIRPDQYSIFKQLVTTTGGIFQLNMGLGTLPSCSFGFIVLPLIFLPSGVSGKTRVLVPMIILDCMSRRTSVARVNVLPSILGASFFWQPYISNCDFEP
jgi:Protein of unknown function (DUF3638)